METLEQRLAALDAAVKKLEISKAEWTKRLGTGSESEMNKMQSDLQESIRLYRRATDERDQASIARFEAEVAGLTNKCIMVREIKSIYSVEDRCLKEIDDAIATIAAVADSTTAALTTDFK